MDSGATGICAPRDRSGGNSVRVVLEKGSGPPYGPGGGGWAPTGPEGAGAGPGYGGVPVLFTWARSWLFSERSVWISFLSISTS